MSPNDVVLCFNGLGGDYPAMGAGLYATSEVFRSGIDHLDREFQRVAGFSLVTHAGFCSERHFQGKTGGH